MNQANRIEFNPLFGPFYVLTDNGVFLAGYPTKFGQAVLDFTPLHVMYHMYNAGIIGTKAELDSLDGVPIELSTDCQFNPVAKFVGDPEGVAEDDKVKERTGGAVFHMDNARLSKTKKQIIEYGAAFGIEVDQGTKNNPIKMADMLAALEASAKEKGLIKEEE